MNKNLAIGIDMGGTTLKGGLVNNQGKISHFISFPIKNKRSSIIKEVEILIKRLLAISPQCQGIGLGWPAPVNISLTGMTIKKILEKKSHRPVFLNNDANCFTLAEAVFGAGKKYPNVFGLTLGTGLGSGLVINRRIYQGRGQAVEIGHTTLDFNGPKCACGNFGCLETFVSKRGIARLAKKHGLREKDGYRLFQLAKMKNKKALMLWQELGKYLGIGIVNIINTFDPDVIILGGGISQAWRFFTKTTKKEINKRSFVKPCPVKLTKLKDGGIIGAALLTKNIF